MNKKIVLFWYTVFLLAAIIPLHLYELIGPSFNAATWFMLGVMAVSTTVMGIALGCERQKDKDIAEKRTKAIIRILKSEHFNDNHFAPQVQRLEDTLKTTPWTRRLADSAPINYLAIPSLQVLPIIAMMFDHGFKKNTHSTEIALGKDIIITLLANFILPLTLETSSRKRYLDSLVQSVHTFSNYLKWTKDEAEATHTNFNIKHFEELLENIIKSAKDNDIQQVGKKTKERNGEIFEVTRMGKAARIKFYNHAYSFFWKRSARQHEAPPIIPNLPPPAKAMRLSDEHRERDSHAEYQRI